MAERMTTSMLHETLRQMAEESDTARRRELFDLLASQLTVQFNQQANNAQMALWKAEESAADNVERARAATDKKIDRVNEQIGNTNDLLSGVIKALADLRSVVEAIDARDQVQWAEAQHTHQEATDDRADLHAAIDILAERMRAYEAAIGMRDPGSRGGE